jgi:hypothetical protein
MIRAFAVAALLLLIPSLAANASAEATCTLIVDAATGATQLRIGSRMGITLRGRTARSTPRGTKSGSARRRR